MHMTQVRSRTLKKDAAQRVTRSYLQACEACEVRFLGSSRASPSAAEPKQRQRAWRRTWRGKVAENMTVWRSGLMFCTMRMICGGGQGEGGKWQGRVSRTGRATRVHLTGSGPMGSVAPTSAHGTQACLRLEAHVEHAVGLVQHQVRNAPQVGDLAAARHCEAGVG